MGFGGMGREREIVPTERGRIVAGWCSSESGFTGLGLFIGKGRYRGIVFTGRHWNLNCIFTDGFTEVSRSVFSSVDFTGFPILNLRVLRESGFWLYFI